MSLKTVKAVYNGGMNFSAEIDGHIIQIDSTEENGGTNLGPRPKALMLAALSGCTGFDVVNILKKMRVEFSDFSVSSAANNTDTEPSIYDEVKIIYTIRVKEEDEEKVEKAVHLSKDKYCGVSKMFEYFAKVNFEIDFL
ncbi:MAG: OsmC family protein [Ginsengibacter sp.]